MLPLPWPVLLSLLSGLGTVFLIAYLWQHRTKPGANWFLLALVAQALWCVSYGVSLLVFDPTLRLGFEIVTWIAIIWTGVPFLAFGLEYTGRGTLIRTPWFALLVCLPILTSVIVVTNPVHGLFWQGFQLDPVYGAATVSYEFEAWAYVAVMVAMVFAASGTLLLFDTVASYGPLYRTEAIAVGLSTLPPGIALLVWAFGLGPVPQLNLSAALFLPHVALDAYAFVGSGMFRFNPATRRTADQSAIEELENPFVVVNTDERVVDLNPAATTTFGVSNAAVLGSPLESVIDVAVDTGGDDQIVTTSAGGEYREYSVSTSQLRDPTSALVGYTLLFQDVTAQRRRKQRLEILNRVLRHNLRNDLNVVDGYLGIAAERVDDDELAGMLEDAQTDVQAVTGMGEKATAFERAVGSISDESSRVDLRELLSSVAADLEGSMSGDVEIDVPRGVVISTNRAVLEQLFANLVENGLEHSNADQPSVSISLERIEDGTAIVTVRDDGPGIPAHELAVLDRGEETALEHGSGLGLWIVSWCVRTIGGELSFETDARGTTVTVRLPGVADSTNARFGEQPAVSRR